MLYMNQMNKYNMQSEQFTTLYVINVSIPASQSCVFKREVSNMPCQLIWHDTVQVKINQNIFRYLFLNRLVKMPKRNTFHYDTQVIGQFELFQPFRWTTIILIRSSFMANSSKSNGNSLKRGWQRHGCDATLRWIFVDGLCWEWQNKEKPKSILSNSPVKISYFIVSAISSRPTKVHRYFSTNILIVVVPPTYKAVIWESLLLFSFTDTVAKLLLRQPIAPNSLQNSRTSR